MMTGTDLGEAIRSGMGFPSPVSAQLAGWGGGVVDHIQAAAIVAHASGLVTGTAPPSGGPLIAGAATGGLISGMSGAAMATLVKDGAGYPSVSSELTSFCSEIVDHIENFGLVTFASGTITGTCTNTPLSPGAITGGAGTGGTISGLDGPTLAASIHGAVGYPGGVSADLISFCTAVTDYIEANAEVEYSSGGITGVGPPAGGPITAGTGAGGAVL